MKLADKKLQAVWDSAECLCSAEALEKNVAKMAAQISSDLADSNPLILCVMNGGLVSCGQMLPLLEFQLQLEYAQAVVSPKGKNAQETRWPALSQISMQGRVVLLVDDIYDCGVSLNKLQQFCLEQGAELVKIAVLVKKKHTRQILPLTVDFHAVEVADQYVFGTGMDYRGYLRNAPGLYAVAPDHLP